MKLKLMVFLGLIVLMQSRSIYAVDVGSRIGMIDEKLLGHGKPAAPQIPDCSEVCWLDVDDEIVTFVGNADTTCVEPAPGMIVDFGAFQIEGFITTCQSYFCHKNGAFRLRPGRLEN